MTRKMVMSLDMMIVPKFFKPLLNAYSWCLYLSLWGLETILKDRLTAYGLLLKEPGSKVPDAIQSQIRVGVWSSWDAVWLDVFWQC